MVTHIDKNSLFLLKTATYASVGTALFLLILKFIAWILTDSVSLQASLLDSFMDCLASTINFFALRESLRPADQEHRFGHGKIEAVAAQGQSIFIAGTAVWLCFDSLHRLLQPSPIEQTPIALAVIGITIIITLCLTAFQKHVIKTTHSPLIQADHLHFKGDLLLNGAVILSLIATSYLGWWIIDPLCALGIGIYIFYTSWKIGKDAFHILIDRELPEHEQKKIIEIVISHPYVKGYHDLKTRSAGATRFIQIHLEMEGTLSLDKAHHIALEVTDQLHKAFPKSEIIIHQDTFDDRPSETKCL